MSFMVGSLHAALLPVDAGVLKLGGEVLNEEITEEPTCDGS